MTLVALGLGTNLAREENLRGALIELSRRLPVRAVSSAWETAPVGPAGQPRYYNAAALLETELGPEELKSSVLRPIERALGRRRSEDRYAPRPIDLDITLWEEAVFRFDTWSVPDPDLLTCLHVALPLAEIAPHLKHPETGERMEEIARRLARPSCSRPGPPSAKARSATRDRL